MKYSLIVLSLLAVDTSAIKIVQDMEIGDDENIAASPKDDIESLMDKYDTAEAEKNKPKPVEKAKDANGQPVVTSAQVQDAELRILSGNNGGQLSQKAADDDMFNACIDKFSSASKENKDMSILTKDNAKEASIELISKKDNIDYMDAEAKVKKSKFDKIWDEHDNMNKGFIDTTEAYGLMQDMASADE